MLHPTPPPPTPPGAGTDFLNALRAVGDVISAHMLALLCTVGGILLTSLLFGALKFLPSGAGYEYLRTVGFVLAVLGSIIALGYWLRIFFGVPGLLLLWKPFRFAILTGFAVVLVVGAIVLHAGYIGTPTALLIIGVLVLLIGHYAGHLIITKMGYGALGIAGIWFAVSLLTGLTNDQRDQRQQQEAAVAVAIAQAELEDIPPVRTETIVIRPGEVTGYDLDLRYIACYLVPHRQWGSIEAKLGNGPWQSWAAHKVARSRNGGWLPSHGFSDWRASVPVTVEVDLYSRNTPLERTSCNPEVVSRRR